MSMPPYSITDLLTEMSYEIGEETVPTSGTNRRKAFLQRTIEEIHRYADWDFTKTTATFSLTAGVATLATTVQLSPNLDIRIKGTGTRDDKVFIQVPYEDQDIYGAGDYRYWFTSTNVPLTIGTSETATSDTLTVRSDITPPDLINGDTTNFPSSSVIVQGALRFYNKSIDPEYDIAQDDAIFKSGLNAILGDQDRSHGPRRAKVRTDISGASMGEIG